MINIPGGDDSVQEKLPESNLKPREEFDMLFFELTGIKADEALKDNDGWLFIPLVFRNEPRDKRGRLSELAGDNGWKNYIAKDEYAGFLIRRPD